MGKRARDVEHRTQPHVIGTNVFGRGNQVDVGVHGASFVLVVGDRENCFRDTCQLLRAKSRPPWHHAVCAFTDSSWLCIEEALDNALQAHISQALHTTVITLYAIDEKSPRFSYRRIDDGRGIRELVYAYSGYPMRGEWTRVEGEPEAWEAALFPDFAAAQPCDLRVLYAIAAALQLPWPRGDSALREVIR